MNEHPGESKFAEEWATEESKAGNDGYLREIQRQIDEKDKVIEALINSLLLAEGMIAYLETACPLCDLPGDYPMYGLATIQETIRLHAAYPKTW